VAGGPFGTNSPGPRATRPADTGLCAARSIAGHEDQTAQTGAVVGALITGIAFHPRLLDPLHNRLHAWQVQSEAELDPATTAVVRLTTHALWTNGLLLTNTISPELLRQVVARLKAFTYPMA
jgi:hypothetical protein